MKRTNSKFLYFIRKNAFYLLLGFCVIAIGLSVTLVLTLQKDKANQIENPPIIDSSNGDLNEGGNQDAPTVEPTPEEKPVETKIVFCMPVNEGSIIKDYSETMVFNSTLNKYSSHLAIDFSAPVGSEVVCVYDGIVESVTTNYLTGATITVDHGNGLKTVYNSLVDGSMVSVGQSLTKGQVIGEVGTSNLQEFNEGAHLHFEVSVNGQAIDPMDYLLIEEK